MASTGLGDPTLAVGDIGDVAQLASEHTSVATKTARAASSVRSPRTLCTDATPPTFRLQRAHPLPVRRAMSAAKQHIFQPVGAAPPAQLMPLCVTGDCC